MTRAVRRARDPEVEFLQWALPRLGLRWAGVRRVRGQVRRRVRRRVAALGLEDLDAYRAYLEAHPKEWEVLDALMPITISRFYRDREVFARLEGRRPARTDVGRARRRPRRPAVLERGLRLGRRGLHAGARVGRRRHRAVPIAAHLILATDVDATVLERARTTTYGASSPKELPREWRERGFVRRGGL
jgi:chemotaxis protein methyltransferase CheR